MQSHDFQDSSCQNPGFSPAFREKTTYSDSSGAIFSMYITRAQKFDEENAENWKGGAEGILVFVRSESRLFNQDNCMLTCSLLSDWPLCIHGGPVYFLELSEFTARPQRHYPIPPFPNIQTASWIPKFYYNYRQSIRQCQFLQTARFCRVRERRLDCQPRAESDVRPYGHSFTTMGSPVPSTYSTEPSTPRPRTHQRVLCARRGQVPRLDVR